jgi:hypothetical protein
MAVVQVVHFKSMNKMKLQLNRSAVITLILIGVVPVLTILSNYSGEVTIKLNTDGIQLQIIGDRSKIC